MDSHETRKRMRSPHDHGRNEEMKRYRSRSPHRHTHHHSHHHHYSKRTPDAVRLPFQAHHLHKLDLEGYRPVFAEYLDIQKGKDIANLDEDEVKGRWKSFLGKWNRGELAEGWYDPETKRKADGRYTAPPTRPSKVVAGAAPRLGSGHEQHLSDEEDDDYGPTPPEHARNRAGPSVPGFQDLQARKAQAEEAREAHLADLRHERKQDRKAAKDRLEELTPRADPGSRERQLEKKREVAAGNRAFRDAKDSGEIEVVDGELMGDDVDSHKAQLKALERKKNERELRKEEVLRARAVEREERVGEFRRKEERTMEMLREIARQRFG